MLSISLFSCFIRNDLRCRWNQRYALALTDFYCETGRMRWAVSTDNDHKHTLTFPSFMINRLEEFHPKIILVAVYWVDSSQCLAVKENCFKIELHYILLIEAWVNSIIKPCFNRASEPRQIKFNCRKGIQLVMTYLIYSWQFLLLLVGAIFSILLKNTGEMGVINYWMYRQIIFPDDSLSRRYKITLSQS